MGENMEEMRRRGRASTFGQCEPKVTNVFRSRGGKRVRYMEDDDVAGDLVGKRRQVSVKRHERAATSRSRRCAIAKNSRCKT